MATTQLNTLLRYLQQLTTGRCVQQWTDRQLLDDFTARRDEAAFAALVSRHGPMVLRVCRRVLHHEQDAEDAFQATFLVLARNTGSIRKRDTLGNWLHGVAYRTAMKAKRSAARRRNHEARLRAVVPQTAASPTWDETQAVLDEEIQRLPPCFREAFVRCVLEGKSGSEAAVELGCKEGTVKSRVNRARRRLQRQLARRGIRLTVFLAALSVAEGTARTALPAALACATIRFGLLVAAAEPAAGVIPSHIAALAAGVTRAMFLTKAKIATALLLAVSVVTSAGVLAHQVLASKDGDEPPSRSSQPVGQESAKAKAPVAAPKSKPGETPTYRGGVSAVPAGVPVLPPGQACVYQGRVLGPDGKPFAGAKLYLAVPEEIAKTRPVRATTGADGRFQFTVTRAELNLPREVPAEVDVFAFLEVVAVAEGYGPDWTPMPDPEGKRPKGELTLRLVKNDVAIQGRILDLQGKPVAGAKVHVLSLETTPEDDLAPFLKAWKSERSSYLPSNLLTKVWRDPTLVGLPKTVTAGTDGRFRLPGVGNERIVVLAVEAPLIERTTFRVLPRSEAEVKALVQAPSEKMMRMGQLPPPPIYPSTFDHLGMPARIIAGTVRDKETGKAMAGIRISGHPLQVTPSRIGPREANRAETYTDKDGNYQLKGLGIAPKYQLFAWPGDFSIYIPGGQEIAGREGLATLKADFELMRGVEVRGRVTDKATGKPVAASVSYRPGRDNTHPGAAYFRMVGKACDGPKVGTFREMVPPGTGVFLVTVRSGNDENPYTQARLDPAHKARSGLDEIFSLSGVNAYRVIEVPADAKSVTCDIQVEPGRTRTGTIFGPGGKPLSGVMVKGLTAAMWAKPTALKNATFTVVGLGPDESREVLFVESKRKLVGRLLVRGDDRGELTVRLEPWAAVTGRVLDEDGQPMAGVRISLSFHHPTFFLPVTWWVSQQGEEVKTDKQGRFHAEGITPGMKFRLHASSTTNFLTLGGGAEGVDELSAGAGQTNDLGDLKAKPFQE
jgi:RNA polymerase sigma factor (sigma-70 family)